MRAIKIGVVVALFAVVAIAFLLGLMWLDHNRETTLPTPTGPFAVGRTTYVWSDPARLDPTAPQPETKRELLAGIWFPAAPRQASQTSTTACPLHGGLPLNARVVRCSQIS